MQILDRINELANKEKVQTLSVAEKQEPVSYTHLTLPTNREV